MISPGDKVKHYEVLELLGKGGMGEVFLAQDTVLDRKVAIKFLPEEMQKDDKARVRLLREAKAAASLDHPFICKIFEAGEIEGTVFIVMEYIEGKDLKGKLEEDTLPLRDSLQMALEIAEALEEAHEKGIVHRDLKPSNIMITPRGHVKVMDFGLAKHFLPQGEEEITKTLTQTPATEQGAIVGTLAYMSPEQARGENVDTQSDIFSLGIILYEMTTGRHPFSKTSPLETLTSILRDSTPAVNIKPRMLNPILSPILRKALTKEPEKRYQKIRDLIEDIQKLHRELTGKTRFFLRGWLGATAAVLVIAMLLTGVWWLTRRPLGVASRSSLQPISVLVADFKNETGDQLFDGTLENAATTGLESAPFVDIYRRSSALRELRKMESGVETKLDGEKAQLISNRLGINRVIVGSIETYNGGFTIKVWALDPSTSEKVVETQKKVKPQADFLNETVRLAARVASKLGGVSHKTFKETFTTSSLQAMKAYTRAQTLNRQGKLEEAIEQYQLAIAEDPDFGRAYSGLALIYRNRGQRQEAERYFQEAMAKLDRMSEREKHRTLGGYFLENRDFKKAITEYSELVRKYPADSAGNSMLALAYFFARDMEKAVEQSFNSLELYPTNIITHYNLVWYAIGAGNFELAEEHGKKVLEINPDFPNVFICLALNEVLQGHPEQAAEKYSHLRSMGPWQASFATTGLGDLALYEGRLNDTKKILDKGIASDIALGQEPYAAHKWIILGETYLITEERALAMNAAQSALNASQAPEILFSAAQIYLEAGEVERAEELADELSKKPQPEFQAYAKLIKGELEMKRNKLPVAIGLFQEAQDQLDTWLGHFALGKAYLKSQDFPAAHSEFDRCYERRGEASSVFLNDIPSCRYIPQIYYYLGRAQEGVKSPHASESYNQFLKIKEKADTIDPMIEDAQQRRDNL